MLFRSSSHSNASSSWLLPSPPPPPDPPAARPRPRAHQARERASASATQSLYVASRPKFASLRLSNPSLLAVTEADATEPAPRPQTSMSRYRLGAHDRRYSNAEGADGDADGDGEHEGADVRRRFSFVSFRRRRFNSEGNVRVAASTDASGPPPAPPAEAGFFGDACGAGDGAGVFARMRRRFYSRTPK